MLYNACVQRGFDLIKNDPSKVLGLSYGGKSLSPGDFVPKADAQQLPELSFRGLDPAKKYIVVSIDPDAPFTWASFLGPINHSIHAGYQPDGDKLVTTEPFVVDWAPPAPPPGSSAHRYVFYLYEQPNDFKVSEHAPPKGAKVGIGARVRFSLDEWEKKVKLGAPVAVNFFTSK